MNFEKEYKATMVGLSKYMVKMTPMITAVLKHQLWKALYSVAQEANKYLPKSRNAGRSSRYSTHNFYSET